MGHSFIRCERPLGEQIKGAQLGTVIISVVKTVGSTEYWEESWACTVDNTPTASEIDLLCVHELLILQSACTTSSYLENLDLLVFLPDSGLTIYVTSHPCQWWGMRLVNLFNALDI